MSKRIKNSNVDWIGEIPDYWETIKLKYLFSIRKKIANQLGYEVLSVTQNGLKIKDIASNEGQISADYSKYQLVDIDDFVMNHMDLLTGWVDCSNYKGVTSPDYRVFKFINAGEHSKRFYTYLFQTCYKNKIFYGLGQGVSNLGRWRLQTDKFLNFTLPKLSIEEQHAIANYLDQKCSEIDRVIQNTRKSIEEYKMYKHSLITEAVTKGLDPNVNFKHSNVEWVGQIPSHWSINMLNQLFQRVKDKNSNMQETNLLSLSYGKIKKKDINAVGGLLPENFTGYNVIESNDIVLRLTDLQNDHTSLRVGLSTERGIITSAYITLRNISDSNPEYLYYYLHSFDIHKGFYGMGSGVRQGLTFDGIKYMKIILPPIEEQNEIVGYLNDKRSSIDRIIEKKTYLITELENYKKSLIYECVTGKRNVGVLVNMLMATDSSPLFPAILPTNKKRFAQAILASKVIDSAQTSQFGRVKLEKILYTLETHIGFDFDTDYERQIAGPLDGSIYQCENIISQKNKWFNINKNKYGVKYKPTKDMAKYKTYYKKYYMSYDSEIKRIINIFKPLSTDEAEIIATLYASWNDFIIKGNGFTDDDIINDVLNNWHNSKKRFSRDTWLDAIEQMKILELIPKGYGKKTIK